MLIPSNTLTPHARQQISRRLWLAAVMAALLAGSVHADDEDEDLSRSLTMRCSYADYSSHQFEAVAIAQGQDGEPGETASTKIFTRGTTQRENAVFRVSAGQAAECVFPSGNRVRVKVGEGVARAYGMCGGNPEVFTSVWVNKRKVLSRTWFAGNCQENTDNPSSFSLDVSSAKIQRCQTAVEAEPTDDLAGPEKTPDPIEACVDFPELIRFPVDPIEYPGKGLKSAIAGDIEVLEGSHPVCDRVANALKAEGAPESLLPSAALKRPDWQDASVDLPKSLAGGVEGILDFNNDGNLDRVFYKSFESNYIHGSILLVQPGLSRNQLHVVGPLTGDKSVMLPCQLGAEKHSIGDCPPFSQKGDESGLQWQVHGNAEPVRFRARYSEVAPFSFRGGTYVDIRSDSHVAVLKPLPNRRFQPMCLLRRVTENF